MNKNKIVLIVLTVLTILANIIAEILPLNNISTAAISNKFQTFFVPAGYVFAIWGLIYVLLLIFAFGYTIVPKKERTYVRTITFWYTIASLADIVWLFCWHYEYFLTSGIAIVTLLISLIGIHLILQKNHPKSLTENITIHIPFHVYLGWVSVATIANISDILWKYGFNGLGLPGQYWAAGMMIIAGILGLIMTSRTENKAFSLVVIWALVGIMVKFSTEYVMLGAGGFSIVLLLGGLAFKSIKFKTLKTKIKK
jgi:hypothetical protein